MLAASAPSRQCLLVLRSRQAEAASGQQQGRELQPMTLHWNGKLSPAVRQRRLRGAAACRKGPWAKRNQALAKQPACLVEAPG
jgi:hypothetical protein